MLVNRYKLTSIITGKVITGTRNELEKLGFNVEYINSLTYTGYLLNQEWRCERLDKVAQRKKKPPEPKPKKKKLSLDDIADMARKAGMNYGEYVALHKI